MTTYKLDKNDLGLGIFDYPIYEFNARYNKLKETNPQLNEQERAAVAYFGMIAQQPKPTRTDYVHELVYDQTKPVEKWLKIESDIVNSKYAIRELFEGAPMPSENAQQSWLNHVFKLQKWLAAYGLWDGIQRTLSEESRKRQSDLAALQASEQAAARALAMSRITDGMSETARIEAAKKTADLQKELESATKKEEELKAQISNLEKGLPPDYDTNKINIVALAGIGLVAAILLLRGRK